MAEVLGIRRHQNLSGVLLAKRWARYDNQERQMWLANRVRLLAMSWAELEAELAAQALGAEKEAEVHCTDGQRSQMRGMRESASAGRSGFVVHCRDNPDVPRAVASHRRLCSQAAWMAR